MPPTAKSFQTQLMSVETVQLFKSDVQSRCVYARIHLRSWSRHWLTALSIVFSVCSDQSDASPQSVVLWDHLRRDSRSVPAVWRRPRPVCGLRIQSYQYCVAGVSQKQESSFFPKILKSSRTTDSYETLHKSFRIVSFSTLSILIKPPCSFDNIL